VLSNVIYATSTTADGDLTNGSTLAEAFARGAAQSGVDYIVANFANNSMVTVNATVAAGDILTNSHFDRGSTLFATNASQSAANGLTVNGTLTLNGELGLQGSNGVVVTLNANLIDAGGATGSVRTIGYGGWTLGGTNSFSGDLTQAGGYIQVSSDSQLGQGAWRIGQSSVMLLNGANVSKDIVYTGTNMQFNVETFASTPTAATYGDRITGSGNISTHGREYSTLSFTGDNSGFTGTYYTDTWVKIAGNFGASYIGLSVWNDYFAPDYNPIYALLKRPELVEEAYQLRIGGNETTKAMLRMLPGIDLGAGLSADSNSFLLHRRWADYSAKVTWNLFNLFTGPSSVKLAEAQERFSETRRLALALAVMMQSRVSWLRYQQALNDWEAARDVEAVEREIQNRVRSEVVAQRLGELEAIQAEFDALLSGLRADLAYTEAQNAIGNIAVTMGYDPLPETLASLDVKAVAEEIRRHEADWIQGRVHSANVAALPAAGAAGGTAAP